MTVRQYLLLMGFSALLCWIAWFFVLFSMEPIDGVVPAVLLFYLTAFCAVSATFSVVGFWVRRRWRPDDLLPQQIVTCFRQSLLLGALVVVVLLLQRQGVLTWMRFVLFVLSMSMFEFIVLAFTSHRRHHRRLLRTMERIR